MTDLDLFSTAAGAGHRRGGPILSALLPALAALGLSGPADAQSAAGPDLPAQTTERGSGDLRIDDAMVAFGRAFVVGHTNDFAMKVTAPTYGVKTRIERDGSFVLQIDRMPEDCIIGLRSRSAVKVVRLDGCAPMGPDGKDGARGLAGPAGPAGRPGARGPAGPAGAAGPTGETGPQGTAGAAGARGVTLRGAWAAATDYATDDVVVSGGSAWRAVSPSRGAVPGGTPSRWQQLATAGAAGEAGPSGPRGGAGATGTAGAAGPTGPKGPRGPAGAAGATGDAGADGSQGPAGFTIAGAWSNATTYQTGAVVARDGGLWRARAPNLAVTPGTDPSVWGVLAAKGETGDTGPDGAQGDKGQTGDIGAKGMDGPIGLDGAEGPEGDPGAPGSIGAVGDVGPQGETGDTGPPGSTGPNEQRYTGYYFVVTAGSWDGNLGGRAGANAKCLADLTSNSWTGRADAENRGLLRATKVRAFICDTTTCQNPYAEHPYRFASPAKGYEGVTVTTGANGYGPYDSTQWVSGAGSTIYWTGRGSTDDSSWSPAYSTYACGNWDSTATNGVVGTAENTDRKRWNAGESSCSIPRKLLCIVTP